MAIVNLTALQPNVPKVNLEDYVFTVYGRPKIGKTTFFHLLMKEAYGDHSKGLILAFEDGYKALKGAMVQPVDDWNDYIDVIDQLIDEKANVPFRVVCHDTVDRMYKMCADYILKRESRKDKEGRIFKVAGDIPFGKGYQYIAEEMNEQIFRLQRAGYGLFFITHDQDKKFESREGVSYDKTTVSLDKRARDIIIDMSDFIAFIENGKEKKGSQVISKRWIYLRSDGSDIEAGSRFSSIREKVEYDPKQFMEAFAEAVLDAHGDESVDIETLSKEQHQEKENKASEFISEDKKDRNAPTLEGSIQELNDLIVSLNDGGKKKAKELCKSILGTMNFKKATDVEKVQQVITELNQ